MSCKGLGVAIKQTLNGDNQLTNWLTWFILFAVGCCITVQMNYLNKALDIFNTSVVTPILYVVFTTFVILASAILFKEWGNLGPEDVVGNICGFLIVVSGIFLLQAFKEESISFSTLRLKVRKEDMLSNMVNGDVGYRQNNDDSSLLDNMEGQTNDDTMMTVPSSSFNNKIQLST